LFEDLGPDAPTLNEGWTNADLAAHLHARERRIDSNAGLVIPKLHFWTARVEEGMKESIPYPALVRKLRTGPPLVGLRDRVDLHEWFVHHEDVRRANGMGPREESPELWALDDAVWGIIPIFGPMLARRVSVGVVLVSHDGRRRKIRRGEHVVEVHGRPTELFLELFNRREVADTKTIGDDTAVEQWKAARLGN
jgi:uncharacterized protein (TIGR03085 family)